jgi:hypothetical protein
MVKNSVIRYAAAALSAAFAVVYFLIAVGTITVVSTASQAGDWVAPAGAGTAFAILAILLIVAKNRVVPILGAAMSVFTIAGYFALAPGRIPSYEIWGISITIAQGGLVLALGILAFEWRRRTPSPRLAEVGRRASHRAD